MIRISPFIKGKSLLLPPQLLSKSSFAPSTLKPGIHTPSTMKTVCFCPLSGLESGFSFFIFFLLFSLCYCSTIHISWAQKIKPIFVLAEHDVMNNFCFWTKFIFFIDFELKISKFYLFSKSFEFLGVTKYLLKSG